MSDLSEHRKRLRVMHADALDLVRGLQTAKHQVNSRVGLTPQYRAGVFEAAKREALQRLRDLQSEAETRATAALAETRQRRNQMPDDGAEGELRRTAAWARVKPLIDRQDDPARVYLFVKERIDKAQLDGDVATLTTLKRELPDYLAQRGNLFSEAFGTSPQGLSDWVDRETALDDEARAAVEADMGLNRGLANVKTALGMVGIALDRGEDSVTIPDYDGSVFVSEPVSLAQAALAPWPRDAVGDPPAQLSVGLARPVALPW